MGTFNSLEEAREFFKNDRFATSNGMYIEEMTDEYSVCSMTITDAHRNAYGGVMGGVIFTLADFSLAVLSNNIHKLSVAQQMSINYLSAPKGSRLFSRAECVKTGRTTTIINIKVTDDMEREVAILTATAFKL
ncbi:MAG: PaaI family thioesterase [Eubacterium sp.]|nr:PaaI family thioesterase [Eubacterium sp.]SEF78335.1 acyl-CoA thioesterase [Eubacterium ruminantium]